MPGKEEKKVALEDVLQIRSTPQIEAALAQQIRELPQLTVEKADRGVKAFCLGLIVCCTN